VAPFIKPIILDNDVLSRLHSVGVVSQVLGAFPEGSFYISHYVIEEAKRWRGKGPKLVAIIQDLEKKGIVTLISINDASEDEIWAYAQLQLEKKLGKGESASIAIASQRGFDIATDDAVAIDICHRLYHYVNVFGTGTLLNSAVEDGLLTRIEADSIQARIRRSHKS